MIGDLLHESCVFIYVGLCVRVCVNSHFWSFGLVLSVEKLWQGSSLNLMDANKKGKEKILIDIKVGRNDVIPKIKLYF